MGISYKRGCDIFCPETVSGLVLQEIQPLNFPLNPNLEPVPKLCESIWSVFLVVTLIFQVLPGVTHVSQAFPTPVVHAPPSICLYYNKLLHPPQ